MIYCMDSSALIDLGERHYPEHVLVFKPIWDFLYHGIEDGAIVSVDYVKIEMEKMAMDWRTRFYEQAHSMFSISAEIESEYGSVIRSIETNDRFSQNKARDAFVSGADPWLIALANTIGNGDATVVSGEKKTLAGYGLGAVCKELKVRHLNLIEMFEENKIGH